MIFPFLRCGLHLIAVAKSAKITSTYLIFSNKENHTIERTKALPDVIGANCYGFAPSPLEFNPGKNEKRNLKYQKEAYQRFIF